MEVQDKHIRSQIVLGILLIFLNFVSSQKIGFGSCPKVKGLRGFNYDRYTTTWYEYARYPYKFEIGYATCEKSEYGYVLKREAEKSILKTGYAYPYTIKTTAQKKFLWDKTIIRHGLIRLDDSDEGKLIINFNGKEKELWVLETNYGDYSVVWSCTNYFGLFNLQYVWIYTKRYPSPSSLALIQGTIEERKDIISANFLRKSINNNC